MSDRLEWWLHFAAGALLAAIELHTSGSAVLALFWPTLVSWVRESEQARAKRKAGEAMSGKRHRPSDVRYWSAHRWSEFLAFTAGALATLGLYALA